jgi:hypothetical protein
MKQKLLVRAISASLLTMAAANVSFAHDILGGQLSALGSANHPQAVDVFRTTCFSWGDGVHDTVAGAGLTGVEVNGAAAGFRFAVNLINTSTGSGRSVTATVGTVAGGNVDNSGCSGSGSLSNCLPYDPATSAPQFASVTDNSVGPAWSQTGAEPDFQTNGNQPNSYWSAPGWVAGGNGEYVIIVQNSSTNTSATANYDFLGHCQNATTGTTSLIHTGQGTWFANDANNLLAPTFDFDQVVNETW